MPTALEKACMVAAGQPRCAGTSHYTGKPCRMLPLKNHTHCVFHTSLRKKVELGVKSALRRVETRQLLAGAPACLRQLPLWSCCSQKMRQVLLEGWLSEINDGVHGAWWVAVMRVLEWREHERRHRAAKYWCRWLNRPLDGTGGATPVPPSDWGWPPPFLQPDWPTWWEVP